MSKVETEDTAVGTTETAGGFDMDEAEQLADREDQGTDVEWEDALGRARYQPGTKTPLTVHVVGSLSKRYRKVQQLQRAKGWKSGIASATKANETEDDAALGERLMREETESVAACIDGWSAGFTSGGKPFAYSKENAIRLLTLNPHMQAKLVREMNDHARFFGQSSTNSRPS